MSFNIAYLFVCSMCKVVYGMTRFVRYILWSMEKFRLGEDPSDFAHAPKPKKKIRG
jgi:hypothetical protein